MRNRPRVDRRHQDQGARGPEQQPPPAAEAEAGEGQRRAAGQVGESEPQASGLARAVRRLRRGRLGNQPEAKQARPDAGRDVEEVVLVGGQHRERDEDGPTGEQRAAGAPEMGGIADPEDDQQRDVQRRRLIERFVEVRQRREHRAEHAAGRGAREAEAQREGEEAGDAQQLRQQQPPDVQGELPPGPADEQRHRVKGVDRPVGDDRPGEEGDVPLPAEGDRAHLGAPARQPVGKAVAGEEGGPEEGEPQRRRLPGPRRGAAAHPATRSASETVKIPQASIFCSSLRKPAASTSWSISSWVRRRMIQGLPSRCEERTRAMSSSWGCHG